MMIKPFMIVGNVLDDFRLSGGFTTSEFLELENSDNVAGNKLAQ